MHPAIIQAAAAQRVRDQFAHATAHRHAAQARRLRREQRSRRPASAPRVHWVRRALRAA
jgi:hypothetical protein